MGRIDKESYYLDIAETVLERSTCSRSHSGALIVRNDEIVSTGYNGAPRGRSNCIDLGYCIRERLGIPAARSECIGGTIYLAGRDVATGELIPDLLPCPMCRRMIINAGLSKIVIRRTPSTYDILNVQDWVFHDDSVIDPSESGEQA